MPKEPQLWEAPEDDLDDALYEFVRAKTVKDKVIALDLAISAWLAFGDVLAGIRAELVETARAA